jgi:general secretion pathway protein G
MKKGFTLIELIVVIAIIAVLAAVVAPNAFKAIDKSRMAGIVADYNAVKTAVMAYYGDVNDWPATFTPNAQGVVVTAAGLTATDNRAGWDGPYLEKWPNARWGTVMPTFRNGVCAGFGNADVVAMEIPNIPAAQATRVDAAIDGAAGAATGVVRIANGIVYIGINPKNSNF